MRAAPPALAHAARLHAQKLQRATSRPQGNFDHSAHQFGLVANINPYVAPNPPNPGSPPTLDLYLDGAHQMLPDPPNPIYLTKSVQYVATYVPTVGDVVLVRRGSGPSSSDRLVLGKSNGATSPYPLPLGHLNSSGHWVQTSQSIWGGPGAPTMPLAAPNANPPVVGVQNDDWYLQTDAAAIWQMHSGTWVPITNGLLTTTQSTTGTYVLQLTDAGTVVEMTANSGSPGINPGLNSSVPFPVGTIIQICQIGTAQVAFGVDGGVTLRSPGGTAILHQYGTATLRQRAINDWVLSGDV